MYFNVLRNSDTGKKIKYKKPSNNIEKQSLIIARQSGANAAKRLLDIIGK